MRSHRIVLATLVAAALALGAFAPVASAHASKTSDDGKIKVTWGWTSEPATTKAKNGLDLVLRYAGNNSGVLGAHEAGLHVELHYGDEALELEALQPQHGREAEGRYTGLHPITPSEPGLYVLHVSGTIEGSRIDLEIPATHEVQTLESTYFPPQEGQQPSGGDAAALEQRIAALEQKVAALEAEANTQSSTPAGTTPQTGGAGDEGGNATPALGVGVLLGAVGASAVALALRRRA